jgi:hypothetical protein
MEVYNLQAPCRVTAEYGTTRLKLFINISVELTNVNIADVRIFRLLSQSMEVVHGSVSSVFLAANE